MDNIPTIQNVEISYPDVYVENMWIELHARRDKLLSTTDWTQLNDSRLTRESFNEWRRWRNSLKQVTSNDYEKIQDAVKALEDIKKLQPTSLFAESQDNDMYNEIEKMKSEIIDLRLEIEDMRVKPINDVSLNELKFNISCRLKIWYEKQLSQVTYAPISIIFERCNQAVDYILSKDITEAPLIENHTTIHNETFDEISNRFIKDKKTLIHKLNKLDNISEKVMHEIDNSTTIIQVNSILGKYNID